MRAIFQFLILSSITIISLSFSIKHKRSSPKEIMSSTYLKFIPINPGFIPEKLNQDKTKEFLNKLFQKCEINFIKTDNIEFVDQGANFESVSCNYCGRDIDMDFWQNSMDKASKSHFKDLFIKTPCCHKITSLNDLQYHSPAGFAKFAITILDPPSDIEDDDLKELEKALGTKIRKIWAHY